MRAVLATVAVVLGMGVALVVTPVVRHATATERAPAAGQRMTELRVRDVIPLTAAHQAAVILTPEKGDLVLPVLVTENEGEQLADQLHGHGESKGLLHNAIAQLGGKLVRVELSRLDGESVIAQLILDNHGRSVTLEGGAADSIGLALEAHVPVLATQAVMDGVGLTRDQIRALAKGGASDGAPASPHGPGHAPSSGAHQLDTDGSAGISL